MAADFFCETIDPSNPAGPPAKVIIPGPLIDRYFKYQPVRYENLRAVKHVLEHPQRIFFGVREYNEGGWCFTGTPKQWYVTASTTAPFPQGTVYAVYMNPNLRIYECRAELADTNDPQSPKDWENRYRGVVWKSTS